MNTKIKFLARLLVLTLFATFISCNEELYEIKNQHNGLDKNKISLTQFKNETNIGRIDPILSVRATKPLSSKTKTQLSDFVIDTLAIKKFISENNKTTYTFRVYPLFAVVQPNDIYNLVYYKVNDTWETSIFYLKKLPEENSEHKLFEKIERIYGGKVTNAVSSKTTNLEMCATEFKTVECNGSCRLEGYSKCDGFSCSTGECITRVIIYGFCSSGSGGGGGTFGDGTVYGGGGTSSSGSYSYSPNYFDNPAFEDPSYFNELNKSYVWSTLSKEQQFFFGTVVNNKYFNETIQYQIDNDWSSESFDFANLARNYKFEHPEITFNDIYYNRTSLDANSAVDINNNTDGGNDTNIYADFNPQQTWTTISQVIPTSQFVGWGSPGIKRNCMDYAKAQIAKNGYQISNYGSAGQTFQIYTEQNGVNLANLTKGLSYLKYALSNNIPVIVGVDDNPGHPGNPDNSTDHFVVIVGMGSNSNGNYFQFYDNASGNTSQGTSPLNLLYYNSSTGKISGKSQCSGYFNSVAHDYIITQIRKSKTKL